MSTEASTSYFGRTSTKDGAEQKQEPAPKAEPFFGGYVNAAWGTQYGVIPTGFPSTFTLQPDSAVFGRGEWLQLRGSEIGFVQVSTGLLEAALEGMMSDAHRVTGRSSSFSSVILAIPTSA